MTDLATPLHATDAGRSFAGVLHELNRFVLRLAGRAPSLTDHAELAIWFEQLDRAALAEGVAPATLEQISERYSLALGEIADALEPTFDLLRPQVRAGRRMLSLPS